MFHRAYCCSRDQSENSKHTLIFYFSILDKKLTKIGQYPSMADLATNDIQKYRNVLKDGKFGELSRAIGLNAHGIGIGAFVYLRRVFESLIEEAHLEAQKSDGWDEDEYISNLYYMENKVKQLGKDFLPDFLVDNWQIYSILSYHIHELSEQDCLAAFQTIKGGIELILDEKIRMKEQQQKQEEISSSINELNRTLKERNKDKSVKSDASEDGE